MFYLIKQKNESKGINMNNMNINSAIADTLDIGNTDTEKRQGS